MNEFELIRKFFNRNGLNRSDVIKGIGDDGAIVTPPGDQALVITTDTLVAGQHFLFDTPARNLGHKALAVNLSDLAAMGATPAWFTLALTLPEINETWLSEFSEGLFTLANRYQTQLIGGDMTRGPLTISITAHGWVPEHQALRRDAAKPGDWIAVTHTLGDAAYGLEILTKKTLIDTQDADYFLQRLYQPEPRIDIGEKLRGHAHAAIDISDGFAADLQHILTASCVGAVIDVDRLPISTALKKLPRDQAIHFALTGGEDYEICFTAPKDTFTHFDFPYTCIGEITENQQCHFHDKNGNAYQVI